MPTNKGMLHHVGEALTITGVVVTFVKPEIGLPAMLAGGVISFVEKANLSTPKEKQDPKSAESQGYRKERQ